MFGNGSRLPSLAVLAAGIALLCLLGAARAGVVRSPHDFSATGPHTRSTSLGPSGVCSACHIPHASQDNVLWPRSLSDYRSKLFQRDGQPTTETNFLLPPTIQCYDCHDFHGGGAIETPSVPALSVFDTSHKPHNVLSGFKKASLGNMTEDGFGTGSALNISGYYETNPLGPSVNYGVNLTAPLEETGGHHFKQDPTTSVNDAYDSGDKLPCRDCHDPHAWDSGGNWQAFYRKNWPSGSPAATRLGTTAVASTFMANDSTPGNRRNNPNSRTLCIACHGNSDTLGPVNFTQIRAEYTNNVPITRPPNTVIEHANASQVACVSCHNHNSVAASCKDCHSFPGLDNTNSARQMSPVHGKHAGRPLPAGFANSRKYDCTVCHFNYSVNHNTSGYTAGEVWQDNVYRPNVNIDFDPAWNPGSKTYRNLPVPTTGGDPPICAGLYCHGDGGAFATRKTGSNTKPRWDNVASGGCGTCHGTGVQMSSANHPAHLDATKLYGPGIDNATCGAGGGCHTVYGLSPTTKHADNTISFRNTPGDNTAVSLSATGICVNCHSTATAAFDNGVGSGVGNTLAKANWLDNNYKLPCLTCHNNASQANSKIDNTGVAAPNIEAYWLVTGHGATAAIDNGSTTTVNTGLDPPVYQNVPVPCGMCHDVNSRHYGTTLATNAWRLRTTSGYNDGNGGLDKFCNTRCHGSAPGAYVLNNPGLPQDHVWILAASPPETKETGQDTHPTSRNVVSAGKTVAPLASDRMPLDNAIRLGGTQNFLCITCHDPHGIGATAAAPRSFTGTNNTTPADNVHMLRYVPGTGSVLCKKCHI